MSDYFSMAEMTESSTAVRFGIDNTPDLQVVQNLSITVTGLTKVRQLLGHPVHVNSGYRCEALEKILSASDYQAWCQRNGALPGDASWKRYFANKAHARGYAADFTCAQFGSPTEIVALLQSSRIAFDQCIAEGDWVHISFDPRLRGEVLTKRFDASGVATSSVPVPRGTMNR